MEWVKTCFLFPFFLSFYPPLPVLLAEHVVWIHDRLLEGQAGGGTVEVAPSYMSAVRTKHELRF